MAQQQRQQQQRRGPPPPPPPRGGYAGPAGPRPLYGPGEGSARVGFSRWGPRSGPPVEYGNWDLSPAAAPLLPLMPGVGVVPLMPGVLPGGMLMPPQGGPGRGAGPGWRGRGRGRAPY